MNTKKIVPVLIVALLVAFLFIRCNDSPPDPVFEDAKRDTIKLNLANDTSAIIVTHL